MDVCALCVGVRVCVRVDVCVLCVGVCACVGGCVCAVCGRGDVHSAYTYTGSYVWCVCVGHS